MGWQFSNDSEWLEINDAKVMDLQCFQEIHLYYICISHCQVN